MSDSLSKIFKAIADPTRREIFHLVVLASTTLSITQISAHFDMTRQGVTKHLNALQSAGLIDLTADGREKFCSANIEPLQHIVEWVRFYDKFWDQQLMGLSQHLDRKQSDT